MCVDFSQVFVKHPHSRNTVLSVPLGLIVSWAHRLRTQPKTDFTSDPQESLKILRASIKKESKPGKKTSKAKNNKKQKVVESSSEEEPKENGKAEDSEESEEEDVEGSDIVSEDEETFDPTEKDSVPSDGEEESMEEDEEEEEVTVKSPEKRRIPTLPMFLRKMESRDQDATTNIVE